MVASFEKPTIILVYSSRTLLLNWAEFNRKTELHCHKPVRRPLYNKQYNIHSKK